MDEEKNDKFEDLIVPIFTFMLFLAPSTLIGLIFGLIDSDDDFFNDVCPLGWELGFFKTFIYILLGGLASIVMAFVAFDKLEIIFKGPLPIILGADAIGSFIFLPITYGLGKVTRKIGRALSKVIKRAVSILKKKHNKSLEIKKEKERLAAKDYLFNPEDMKVINKEENKEKSHLEQIQKELNDCKKYKEELTLPVTSILEEDKVLGLK